MPEVGSASLAIIPSFKGFGTSLDRGVSTEMTSAGARGGAAFGDSAGKAASGKFSQRMKSLGKVAALGLAGAAAGALKFSADAVKAASDIEESTNKLNQVFGPAADQITKFSGRAAKALGQTNLEARNAAATFGIYGKAANLTNKQNAKFAKQMTTLASDLASFHNVDPAQAVEALGSAFRGEAEPMRQFGVLMDADTLKAEALAEGLVKPVKDLPKIQGYRIQMIEGQRKVNEAIDEFGEKSFEAEKATANLGAVQGRLAKALDGTVPALTQEQKILAARSLIMKQTADAQGDFARTSDGLANQQRILKARWEDSKIALGEALLPAINDAVQFLNDKGIPAFERFSDWFVDKGIPAIKDAKEPLKTAVGYAKDLAGFLGKLPNEAKIAGLVALVGGIGAMKVRGGALGGGGALGTAGKVLGLAKPVPVIVMNKTGPWAGGVPGGAAGSKTPPIVAGGGNQALKGAARGSRFLKFAPLLPAAGALGNDQLPDLMTDKQADDWKRYHANINRATDFWLHHNERIRNGTIPMVDATHEKFKDLFGVVKDVDRTDPKITTAFPGYSDISAKMDKLKGDMDYIARPRYIRMTITRDFDTMGGRRTMPGLQEYTNSGGGTTINIGRVEAKDYDDFNRQLEQRRRRAALEGRRVG